MDRTTLFKASVKTIRTRNKALGVKETGKGTSIFPSRNNGKPTKGTEFGSRAKEVLFNITKLRDFLIEHRKDYIDAFSHLSSELSRMTDTDRDQIDNDAETYMRTCHASIRALKNEASLQSGFEQVKTHKSTVVEMLEEYLKVVCKLYSEQRAIRVKRVVDKKRISRLQPEHKRRNTNNLLTEEKSINQSTDPVANSPGAIMGELLPEVEEDEELSPDEVQLFEQENKKLFEEMNSLVDEVRQIEGKVVQISRLQEVFSEKVLQQSGQIDRIYETAVGTTENVKDGNEQIREAIKNNASFRVWILFFLVMCSFSLLFLDWYS